MVVVLVQEPQEWVVLLVRVAELVAVRLVVVQEVESAVQFNNAGLALKPTQPVIVL